MLQYFTWYFLQLKAWIKRITSCVLVIAVVFLILICSKIRMPSVENKCIGIYIQNTKYETEFWNCLNQMDSIFTFQKYDDESLFYKDVENGILECGFSLAEDFDHALESVQPEKAIVYVCTPLTSKGEVAKETIYSAFLSLYSETLLEQNFSEVYGSVSKEQKQEILTETMKRFDYYLNNSRLLQMDTIMVDASGAFHDERLQNTQKLYPIHGIAAFLLFLILWMEQGKKFEQNRVSIYAALDSGQRRIFRFCGNLGVVTIPAAASFISILCFVENRGVWKECAAMILFVLIASFWVLLIGDFFKKSSTFSAWTITLLFVQLIVCPVFFDLSVYFPALSIIRFLFPINWYLF